MIKIAFLIHGKFAHRNAIIAEAEGLFATGYAIECHLTNNSGQFTPLAYGAIKNGATHVICAGGDGSLNEAANGLMQAKNDASLRHINWQSIRLGLLPCGTGNDFAKTVHVANNLAALKQLIETDSFKAIDLGLAQVTTVGGEKPSRYFINIMDVGIGGTISQKISKSSKPLGAFITYQMAIINALLTYKNETVTIKADTFEHTGPVMGFIMAKGKYFGAGLGIAPDALPDNGRFSTVVIGDISITDYLKNLGKMRKCIKVVHPQLQYVNASNVTVTSPDKPLPIDMDGEFAGYTPLKLLIVPRAVNFLCPL